MILNAAERGAGGSAPLVLLHGLFGQAGNFGGVQRRLAERRRVIALDLRNHGRSARAASMSYREMAADVLETLRRLDALPCVLAGHSMGGKTAMMAALTAPEAVARLAVVDIAPVPYPAGYDGYIAAMQAIPLHPGLTRPEADAALHGAVRDARVRAFLLTNLDLGAAPSWRLNLPVIGAALRDIGGWAPPDGAHYTGPALFLHGARSDYVEDAARPAILSAFPAARFATLPTGHWVHAEDPDGFVAALDAFAD